MCLLNLIKEYNGVGTAAYTLGKLSALFVTYISRRSTDKARDSEFFHVFAHVYAYERIGTAEHEFRKLLCQKCLAHTGRTKEHECADRLVGVLQSDTAALDGLCQFLYCIVLRDDLACQLLLHPLQACPLILLHTLHGNTRNH